MAYFDESNLLPNSTLREYFIWTSEWSSFWKSFEEAFINSSWRWNKAISIPIIFRIEEKGITTFAWKIVVANKNSIDFDIFSDLHESTNLLLLMSYLIKNHIETKFKKGDSWMWFKEISLSLSDTKMMTGERIRQIYSSLCNDIGVLLTKNKLDET